MQIINEVMLPWHLLLLLFIPIVVLLVREGLGEVRRSKKLPPGSLGIPFIGQSLQLLRAMRTNTGEKWVQQRVNKYGPVSKLRLFGKTTVLLKGPAAQKMIFCSDAETLSNEQPRSVQRILGERSLPQLHGEDHKRVRGALMTFLKPEVLKHYVPKMSKGVQMHLDQHWKGQPSIKVMPLMKTLTFDLICSLLFGLEEGPVRQDLVGDFEEMMLGLWAVPIDLPFTRFNRSLRASKIVHDKIMNLVEAKRLELQKGRISTHSDLISCLLNIAKDEGEALTEEEIADNVITALIAGYDTSSVVITFLIRHLANDPEVLAKVVQEQDVIAKEKACGEPLTWNDISKMKYTWRVVMEILRLIPPAFGGFRQVLKDIEFDGYLIPKGWQIFWAPCTAHMDEAFYPEPWKFDPSRFDAQSPAAPYSWIPFGGGPRMCPGNELARLEILTAMHLIVTQFKWTLWCKDDTYKRDPFPEPNQGLPILLEARE